MTIRHSVWLCVLLPVAIGSNLSSTNAGSNRVADGPIVQGITPEERQEFYHLPEGSELYPLAWIKVMKDPKTNDFFLKNIERFGMLPDPNDPNGLPIGVSRGSSRGLAAAGDMIGVNCAACHVAQLTYKGKTLRIDGGPSLISMDRFYGDLFGAAGKMLKDPTELAAFNERLALESGGSVNHSARTLLTLLAKIINKAATIPLKPAESVLTDKFKGLITKVRNDTSTLRANFRQTRDQIHQEFVTKYQAEIDSLVDSIHAPDLSGVVKEAFPDASDIRGGVENLVTMAVLLKGRVDFLLKIKDMHAAATTTTIGGPGRSDAFGVISNMVLPGQGIKLDGPVSYPYIWSIGPKYETDWFHYDGNTTSLLQRNVGQAVGLGAAFDKNSMTSTIKIREMDRLQQITRRIRPPEWPADLFGAIDKASADRGATLYKDQCLSCHADAFETDPLKREKYVDYKEVGTDPNRIDNYQINVLKTAKNPAGTPYIKALAGAADALTVAAYKDANVTAAEQKVMEPRQVEWVSKKAYMARPLVAIWATAPYLHNGSVPTLADLLTPAAQRPKYFLMGDREYDPVKVGYVCKVVDGPSPATPPLWTFDTTESGNSNRGHEYGVDLTEDQKKDLIEYLKGNYAARDN